MQEITEREASEQFVIAVHNLVAAALVVERAWDNLPLDLMADVDEVYPEGLEDFSELATKLAGWSAAMKEEAR